MITIVRPDDRQLAAVDPATTGAPPEELQGSRRQIVSSTSPYVHVASHRPGLVVATHSHPVDEVMIVLEGSVEVAETLCQPGTVLVIPANERYSLAAGQQGVTYAVVRPGR